MDDNELQLFALYILKAKGWVWFEGDLHSETPVRPNPEMQGTPPEYSEEFDGWTISDLATLCRGLPKPAWLLREEQIDAWEQQYMGGKIG